MKDNVFAKIISGEIPTTKVYEDDKVLAFLDINPVSKGHTLLVPKKGYIWMQDVPDELLSHCFVQTKKLMSAIKNAFGCDFVQINVVGEEIPHFHIHLYPRWLDDGLPKFPTIQYASKQEEKETAQKISDSIE